MTPNIKADMFSRILDTNVRGTMLCVRAVSKAMAAQEPLSYESRRSGTRSLGRGSIVNLGSVNSYVAAPGMMPYTASKHAIIGITKTAGMSYSSWLFRLCLILLSSLDLPASCHFPQQAFENYLANCFVLCQLSICCPQTSVSTVSVLPGSIRQ